jgi:hypothetical protein
MRQLNTLHAYVISLLLVIGLVIPTMGQTTIPGLTSEAELTPLKFMVNDTLRKWRVGINIYPYVKADELFEYALQPRKDYLQVTFPVEFLARKQYKLDRAFRVRVMGVFENFQDEDFNAADQDTKLRSLSIALGHEWQQVIGKRWEWYYGVELQVRRTVWNTITIDDTYFFTPVNDIVRDRREFDTFRDRLSVLPLIGARFQITPGLFASVEGSIEMFWEEYIYDDQSVYRDLQDLDNIVGGAKGVFQFSQSGLRFLPYSGLYINVIF